MTTFSRVRRKRGPALAWAPAAKDSFSELTRMLRPEARTPLFLTQAALLEIEAHARGSTAPLPFGLLAGDVCLCPQTNLEYLLVDTVARARTELGGDDPYAELADELRSLVREHSDRGKVPIGWYLGGMGDDLTLDSEVATLHRQIFPERWQVAFVRGESSGIERGAVLRFENAWDRWYSIPFFEFLSERAWQRKGEQRTAVRWENYQPDKPALPLDEPGTDAPEANAPVRSWWATRSIGISFDSFRRGGGATTEGPRERPLERVHATSAPVRQSAASAPRSPGVLPTMPHRRVAPTLPTRSTLLEIDLTPHGAPSSPLVEPVERATAAPAEPTIPAAPEQTEVEHVFIDGSLVPVPLASDLSPSPGPLPTSDRVRLSSLVVGVLLVLMLLALYLIAS